jgi:hypothetical protein
MGKKGGRVSDTADPQSESLFNQIVALEVALEGWVI